MRKAHIDNLPQEHCFTYFYANNCRPTSMFFFKINKSQYQKTSNKLLVITLKPYTIPTISLKRVYVWVTGIDLNVKKRSC